MSKYTYGVLGILAGLIVGCGTAPVSADSHYDDKSLNYVAVQEYTNPHFRNGNNMCLVFTHDTMQGASMSVVC